jgi:hypothetical protein
LPQKCTVPQFVAGEYLSFRRFAQQESANVPAGQQAGLLILSTGRMLRRQAKAAMSGLFHVNVEIRIDAALVAGRGGAAKSSSATRTYRKPVEKTACQLTGNRALLPA